ncbi:MAG: coenzyme F420-0:L-glutamate ligase [Alistipes sp.]|nr:coenzyme F420-0:L-glutamate ligase [Alistipes sp.]
MAKYLYEGNLNEAVNRHKKGAIEYYVRGTVTIGGRLYERYGIKTHFIGVGEDYIELIRRYILPFIQAGDLVSTSEKVISMCQANVVRMEDMKLSRMAKWLSRFGKKTDSGIGITEPYKLQLMMDRNGMCRVLCAGIAGAVAKLVGKRGVFYEILGEETAGIDGFYSHSAFETYHTMATLNPKDPDKVCKEIYEKCHVPVMIVDANDIDVHILGKPEILKEIPDGLLAALIMDNPAGQDDEQTPFVVIRDITGKMPQPYTPKKPISAS